MKEEGGRSDGGVREEGGHSGGLEGSVKGYGWAYLSIIKHPLAGQR